MTLLICSAFLPEIQILQKQSQGSPNVFTATLGVGLVSAASRISSIMEYLSVSRILFTGTCGILTPSPISIGDIVRAKMFYSGDVETFAGANLIPEVMPTVVPPARFMTPKNPIQDCDVLSPLSITHSKEGADVLRNQFPEGIAENLECFAVAWNAAQRGIPFEAILGVTNTIGPQGHTEWRAHHEDVSRVTQEWLQASLHSIFCK